MALVARRTQEQRRTETRVALLDAALECLVQSGMAGFTTTEVCRRAELSQGALFKHFGSKADLLAATAEFLFDGLRADYEAAFLALPETRRTATQGLDLLWDQMLDVRLAAAYELFTAARTDVDLQASLEPVVKAHTDRIHAMAETLVGGQDPRIVHDLVDLAVVAIQGLVLNQMALHDGSQVARLRAALEALALTMLEVPSEPDRTGKRDHRP